MIVASQSTHTLDVLAVLASALAVATALLALAAVILVTHITKNETRRSAQSLSDLMKELSKRGVDHAHRAAASRHSHH